MTLGGGQLTSVRSRPCPDWRGKCREPRVAADGEASMIAPVLYEKCRVHPSSPQENMSNG